MNELDTILLWLTAIVVASLISLASIVGADLTGWLP